MPYAIRYVKGEKRPWKIINKDRNEVVGSSTNKADAEASVRARTSAENDQDNMRHYIRSRKKATSKGK